MRQFTVRLIAAATVALGVVYAVAAQSPDPWMGAWKLNVAKSTFSPGPAPRAGAIHTFATAENGFIKHTIDGINAEGQPTHTEVVVKFDGKDYPVKGAAPNGTRSYRRIDDRTIEVINKVDGKVVNTVRDAVSQDGKTRTGKQTGQNPQGQVINNTTLFEKQ